MKTYLTHGLRRGIAALGLAALCIGLLPLAASAQKYVVTNLGPLLSSSETDASTAVSSDGTKVVGQANVNGTLHSFYWDGAMHDAGVGSSASYPQAVTSSGIVLIGVYPAKMWTLAGGSISLTGPGTSASALNMNETGIVVGHGTTSTILNYNPDGSPNYARIGLRWSENTATGAWDYTLLQPPAGYSGSYAFRIDEMGNIIGTANNSDPATGANTQVAAVRWSPGDNFQPRLIGPLAPQGFIKGFAVDPALNTKYIWNDQATSKSYYTDGSGTQELPQPASPNPQNIPQGINADGLVTGFATYGSYRHAYTWFGGVQTDLGVLSGMTTSEMSQNMYCRPVNVHGFTVGWSTGSKGSKAFLSTPTSRASTSKMLDLNLMLSNTLKSVGLASVTQGISINDAGFIICDGLTTGAGYRRAALLKPVP